MIENKEIEFDPQETSNVITAPIPKHDKGISAIEDVMYVASVSDVVTPLSTIKKNCYRPVYFWDVLKNVIDV